MLQPQRGAGVGNVRWGWAGAAAAAVITVIWAVVYFPPARVEETNKGEGRHSAPGTEERRHQHLPWSPRSAKFTPWTPV